MYLDLAKSLDKACVLIKSARRQGAELIVVGELASG
jgi:predicted amidohydrolase